MLAAGSYFISPCCLECGHIKHGNSEKRCVGHPNWASTRVNTILMVYKRYQGFIGAEMHWSTFRRENSIKYQNLELNFTLPCWPDLKLLHSELAFCSLYILALFYITMKAFPRPVIKESHLLKHHFWHLPWLFTNSFSYRWWWLQYVGLVTCKQMDSFRRS